MYRCLRFDNYVFYFVVGFLTLVSNSGKTNCAYVQVCPNYHSVCVRMSVFLCVVVCIVTYAAVRGGLDLRMRFWPLYMWTENYRKMP